MSFLNLPKSEENISNERLQAVVCGISELTEDIGNQKRFAREIIELKANDIITKDTISEVYEKTKQYVKVKQEELLQIEKKAQKNKSAVNGSYRKVQQRQRNSYSR